MDLAVVVPNHENQISKIDGGDVVKDGISSLEKDSDSADKDHFNSTISKSLDGDAHEKDLTNIEDSQSSQQPAQLVVGGDDVATDNKMLLDSEKEKRLIVEEIQNQSMSCDSSQAHSNIELEIGDANQVTDTGKAKSANNTSLDSTSCHPVSGEVMEIDDTIHSDPNHEVLMHVSGEDPGLKLEESLDKKVKQDPKAVEASVITYGRRVSGLRLEEHQEEVKVEGLNGNKPEVDEDAELVDSYEEQKTEAEEQDTDSEEPKTTEKTSTKRGALRECTVKSNGAIYKLPPDDVGEFGVSDLVWGKVRSHPWWPGQIFHPSDASEKAMKYHKKDSFLVAYFGDKTFAWNDASVLKPFRSHFSQVQKQSSSETFQNAVNSALEEVSRRVEFALTCSCIPEDVYDKIKHQTVENAGIREESSVQNGIEKSLSVDLFEPVKLVEYMKALAQSPYGGANRVQIVIARSQLTAFCRMKGYFELPEFQFCGGLLEDSDSLQIEDKLMAEATPISKEDMKNSSGEQTQKRSCNKRKHNLKDNLHPKKKEKSMNNLMVETWDSVEDEFGSDRKSNSKLLSPSSRKKRRGLDELELRKTAKESSPVSLPKPSFKIGDCIRRVASQMTGSPILKATSQKIDEISDRLVTDGSDGSIQESEDSEMKKKTGSTEYSSLDELLLQLYLAAKDPLKGYSFLTVIVSFFSDFRNAAIMELREKISKDRQLPGGTPESFEFEEDMNDTYWTDRVIQNGSEEQPPTPSEEQPPSRKSRKRDPDKPHSKSKYRKRNSDSNHGLSEEKEKLVSHHVDENAPAELVMHFPVVDYVPSEASLVKMFKSFGPLKESETEIDKDTNRARVVFKKYSDAKAAYSSATKFSIFGSVLVNYQLNSSITVPFKTEALVSLQGEGDAGVFLQF